jgi:hypothetical protein
LTAVGVAEVVGGGRVAGAGARSGRAPGGRVGSDRLEQVGSQRGSVDTGRFGFEDSQVAGAAGQPTAKGGRTAGDGDDTAGGGGVGQAMGKPRVGFGQLSGRFEGQVGVGRGGAKRQNGSGQPWAGRCHLPEGGQATLRVEEAEAS